MMMTRNELIERINIGCDIMFDCRDKRFAIAMTQAGADIAEQTTGKNRAVFPDGASLVAGYCIDGIALADLMPQIKITFCS